MIPGDVDLAMNIEALCRRYGCLPSQAAREPAWVVRHMAIVDLWMNGEGKADPDGE